MNKKKENRPSVREASVTVPMTMSLRKDIEKACDRMGVSMTVLIRLAITDYLKRN